MSGAGLRDGGGGAGMHTVLTCGDLFALKCLHCKSTSVVQSSFFLAPVVADLAFSTVLLPCLRFSVRTVAVCARE